MCIIFGSPWHVHVVYEWPFSPSLKSFAGRKRTTFVAPLRSFKSFTLYWLARSPIFLLRLKMFLLRIWVPFTFHVGMILKIFTPYPLPLVDKFTISACSLVDIWLSPLPRQPLLVLFPLHSHLYFIMLWVSAEHTIF